MRIYFLFFISITIGCAQSIKQDPSFDVIATWVIDSSDQYDFVLKNLPREDYNTTREYSFRVRDEFNKRYVSAVSEEEKNRIISEAQDSITQIILRKIIPHWYGTEWSFPGHTETPKSGTIACGYFVSTTLLHSGFNINRYTLAQQPPLFEAKTISDKLLTLAKPDIEDDPLTHQLSEGLYFVGLDFHVGYLYKWKQELYFIHSNYVGAEGVTIERADTSEAFNNSYMYYISPITGNKKLVLKWILNQQVKVVTTN